MKLYSAPGTCGTAMHIALEWIGKPFEVEHLGLAAMKSPEYLTINPAGVVPALVDEEGPLSEGLANLLKLVDDDPDANIGPARGAPGRNQLYRWLVYVSATLHPFFWPYFMPQRYHADDNQFGSIKEAAQERVAVALNVIEANLDGKTWMLGDQKSAADAFLYPMVNWAHGFDKPTSAYPKIDRVIRQLAADPTVQKVHQSQGTSPNAEVKNMKPVKKKYSDADLLDFPGAIELRVLLCASDTDGSHAVFEDIVEPGVGPGRHVHHGQDETFFFLEGSFDVEIDGVLYHMEPGDVGFVPRETVHAFKNVGKTKGRIRYIFSPALEIEEMFRAFYTAQGTGGLTEQAMIEIAAAHGQSFSGPPL